MSCYGCNKNWFSNLENTWTPASSLHKGVWGPYNMVSVKEKYCSKCSCGGYSSGRHAWSSLSNVAPINSRIWTSAVVKPPVQERYNNGRRNNLARYTQLDNTWDKQSRYEI